MPVQNWGSDTMAHDVWYTRRPRFHPQQCHCMQQQNLLHPHCPTHLTPRILKPVLYWAARHPTSPPARAITTQTHTSCGNKPKPNSAEDHRLHQAVKPYHTPGHPMGIPSPHANRKGTVQHPEMRWDAHAVIWILVCSVQPACRAETPHDQQSCLACRRTEPVSSTPLW